MDQAIRAGDPATGAHTITVEKHKNNFRTQYGTFEDKESQNIARWLGKADNYQDAHMIQSLEMGSILIHCIKGEPERKVRRMLDVPGDNYINANHYSQQPIQLAVAYAPYIPAVPAGNWPAIIPFGQPDAGLPHPQANQVHPIIPAQPRIEPVRFQPLVLANQCLKHYLLTLYEKRVNLAEAEKFLQTFKNQKPKQTCSNFIDELMISYENYAHMKWTLAQLNGIPEQLEVLQADEQPGPPIVPAQVHIPFRAEVLGNMDTRQADKLQLISNGLCKEFKVHCDNIQFNLATTTIPELETQVQNWQRNTTTGKLFTASCSPASAQKSASVSLLEVEDPFATSTDTEQEAQVSSASTRGLRGGRGRGGRGRGRGGRGKPATSNANVNTQSPSATIQSRDTMDGGHFNYRQAQDGTLMKSIHGHALCNYCGLPSHKRERCYIKEKDRKLGITRIYHPNRDKAVSSKTKAQIAMATAMDSLSFQNQMVSAAMPNVEYPQWALPQWIPPTQYPQAPPVMNQSMPWPQPGRGQNNNEMHLNSQTSAAATTGPSMPRPCPYTACSAMLSDPHASQEHMFKFHGTPTLAPRPGFNP